MNGLKVRIVEGHGPAVSVQSTHQSTRFLPERNAAGPRWLLVEALDDELIVIKANGSNTAALQIKALGGSGGAMVIQQGDDIRHLGDGQTVLVYLSSGASVICRSSSMRSPDGRRVGMSNARGADGRAG